jgi:hypothetical protein
MKSETLAVFREQVKAEKKRGHMSPTAVANLRAIKDQKDYLDSHYERLKKFLSEVRPTPENLAKLIQLAEAPPADTGYHLGPGPDFEVIKTVKPVAHLARRVQKLMWWIDAGFLLGREIDSLGGVNFMSILVGDERKMSDVEFTAAWSAESAKKLKDSRIRRGMIPADEKPTRKKRAPNKAYIARVTARLKESDHEKSQVGLAAAY